MRIIRTILPALAAVSLAGAAAAQHPPAPPTIRVAATGEVHAAPDEAWVDLGVETQAPTARAAAEANAAAMQRVIEALVRAGVPRDEIATQGFNVFPEYDHRPDGTEPRVRGYRVSNVVTAHLTRVDLVGAAIDAGLAAGANRVNGVRFGVREADRYRAQAVQEAVRRARAEAEAMAAALGVALGPVQDASTVAAPVRPVPVMEMARMQMASDAAPTPIQPGEQSISATVTLVFRIGS